MENKLKSSPKTIFSLYFFFLFYFRGSLENPCGFLVKHLGFEYSTWPLSHIAFMYKPLNICENKWWVASVMTCPYLELYIHIKQYMWRGGVAFEKPSQEVSITQLIAYL